MNILSIDSIVTCQFCLCPFFITSMMPYAKLQILAMQLQRIIHEKHLHHGSPLGPLISMSKGNNFLGHH